MSQLKDIVGDCEKAWPLATWWAETLGYRMRPHTDDDLAQLKAQGRTESTPTSTATSTS